MNITVVVTLNADSNDPSQGPLDKDNYIVLVHKLEFILSGDNLNGPSIVQMEKKFFDLAKEIRNIIT